MKTKLDLISAEYGDFDILSFTETWLNHSTPDRDIKLDSINIPLRKERVESSYGGVAVYIKKAVHYERKTDLEINGLECVWVELNIIKKKDMYGTFCVPPSSPTAVWLSLEISIELSLDCNVDAFIVVGDFNDNLLDPHCHKVKDFMRSYSLHQLINEATNFTEHSQSLMLLILTKNPSCITYTEVGSAFTDLTRFHCPTYGMFNCKKHTSSCYKRSIWLYDKGNYDDLRRVLQSVQLDTLIIEHDVNQRVTNFTRTILWIAMSNVPKKPLLLGSRTALGSQMT